MKWVSVKERQPNKHGEYLGSTKARPRGWVFVYAPVGWICSNDYPVTHWMPMPERPRCSLNPSSPETASLERPCRISDLEEKIEELEKRNVGFIKINLLASKKLSAPLDIIVEPDEDGFIARSVDIPLYGYGYDALEALDALKCEIESLYDDLMENDKFTDEWLRIKEFLHERIVA